MSSSEQKLLKSAFGSIKLNRSLQLSQTTLLCYLKCSCSPRLSSQLFLKWFVMEKWKCGYKSAALHVAVERRNATCVYIIVTVTSLQVTDPEDEVHCSSKVLSPRKDLSHASSDCYAPSPTVSPCTSGL